CGTVMLMLAVAETVLSVTEVAVRLTCEAKAVTPDGAVYETEPPLAACWAGNIPQSTFEQSTPGADMVQLTPAFAGSFITVATRLSPSPTFIAALAGSMEIEMGPAIVTIAEAAFV